MPGSGQRQRQPCERSRQALDEQDLAAGRRRAVEPGHEDAAQEEALRAANTKFERRFRAMEDLAQQQGAQFDALNLDEQEALWDAVKQSEPGKPT